MRCQDYASPEGILMGAKSARMPAFPFFFRKMKEKHGRFGYIKNTTTRWVLLLQESENQ
jgi:hypothetical protein